MISYYSTARKSVKWYRKILFQCVSIAVLNSWVLYNRFYAPQKKMTLVSFIKSIVSSLLYVQETSIDKPTREAHQLVKIARGPKGKINRKRCNGCYARISKDRGQKEAVAKTKKVDTQCTECKKAFLFRMLQPNSLQVSKLNFLFVFPTVFFSSLLLLF